MKEFGRDIVTVLLRAESPRRTLAYEINTWLHGRGKGLLIYGIEPISETSALIVLKR